ncbi:DNA topoisomerase-1 [Loktanella fryxellensis]|uniref:DNA topoisomerase n=1 Tax=Loktanella fryxellensis TaxID=245187 RepID=A0A1H8CZ60_9RHOB|nr:DNA topoisomerase IB [Loktanella fryxellensis]SEN00169.1 DNA topoisomerase-1 [Loktanella fryxellensis]
MAYADIAKVSGLLFYPDTEPGIRRRRAGRGFSYTAADGTRIDDTVERARIAAIAVPPAYGDVWISPLPKGHLQATGFDDRERKQYRYHADWTAHHALLKFENLGQFAQTLPGLRRWIASRLRGEVGDRDTAIAATLALIDRASLRVGNGIYAAQNGSYGATTMLNDHGTFEGGRVRLDYIGKGGARIEKDFHAPRLAEVLDACQDLPGAEIITWIDDAGTSHPVRSDHINQTLHTLCGDHATAKTMRTWNGSLAAFEVAAQPGKLSIAAMADAASDVLCNTPTVARNSYVHPSVIALAEMEATEREAFMKKLAKSPDIAGLRQHEPALAALLQMT